MLHIICIIFILLIVHVSLISLLLGYLPFFTNETICHPFFESWSYDHSVFLKLNCHNASQTIVYFKEDISLKLFFFFLTDEKRLSGGCWAEPVLAGRWRCLQSKGFNRKTDWSTTARLCLIDWRNSQKQFQQHEKLHIQMMLCENEWQQNMDINISKETNMGSWSDLYNKHLNKTFKQKNKNKNYTKTRIC